MFYKLEFRAYLKILPFMKKLFYSFATIALGLTLAACSGKTESNPAAADSTVQEPVAEEAPSREIANDLFSVTGPEGWELSDASFGRIRMEDVKSSETFKPVIKVGVDKEKSLKDKEEYYLTKTNGYKKGENLTIGAYTFTTFRNEDSQLFSCCVDLEGGGVLEVETVYFPPEDERLKPVVESIKLK